MGSIKSIKLPDQLHRTAKLLLDNGEAESIDEAYNALSKYAMSISISAEAARSPTHQAALLTALNCGRRSFLGGVEVFGAMNAPLLVPLPYGATLGEAVTLLGGKIVEEPSCDLPLVEVGPPLYENIQEVPFAIRTTFEGWRGGIIPANSGSWLAEATDFTPAGVLAGALATAEVFAYFRGEPMAGYRSVGLSLWNLSPDADWLEDAYDGPVLQYLPSNLWLIGLGHLGQAYLWTLGMLPYATPSEVNIVLQDKDHVGESTESTSILTDRSMMGLKKTRAMAEWSTKRGFQNSIVERLFTGNEQVVGDEPKVALCGVDNVEARRVLENAGFDFIVEAGLGKGVEDFRQIRLHTFPGPLTTSEIWRDQPEAKKRDLPKAYVSMLNDMSLDQCGVTQLADKAVGAPFVGTVAAALTVAEVLRIYVNGARTAVLNIDLRSSRHRSWTLIEKAESINPGYTLAITTDD